MASTCIHIITYKGNNQPTQKIKSSKWRPDIVIIYQQLGVTTLDFGIKTTKDGANTKYCDAIETFAWRYQPDHIISLDEDGFTVGDGTGSQNIFNLNGVTYTAILCKGGKLK